MREAIDSCDRFLNGALPLVSDFRSYLGKPFDGGGNGRGVRALAIDDALHIRPKSCGCVSDAVQSE
jgi:hypothetical protein